MKNIKKLGVWLDHSNAQLMDLTNDRIVTNEIVALSLQQDINQGLNKNENLYQKEKHHLSDYYKKLIDAIKEYDYVLLFGPAEAKKELSNLLKDDNHFDHIKIDVKPADKMTIPQKQAFVREYFNTFI